MIGHSTLATAYSSSGSLSFDLGLVPEGTLLVAILRSHSAEAKSEFSIPTGWARTGPKFIPSNSRSRVLSSSYKICTPEDSNTSIEFHVPGISSGRTVGVILGFSGVDTSNPIVGSSDIYTGSSVGGVSTHLGGGVYSFDTTPTGPIYQITFGASELVRPHEVGSITSSPNSSLITSTETAGGSTVTRSVIAVVGSEISGDPEIQYISWPAISGATGHSITLQGIVEGPSEPDAFRVSLANGKTGSLHLWDGSSSIPVKSLSKVHRGFDSVDHMLTTPGFTWAHRGGSANWGEMSLHAYTQSLIKGYGVLELSLGRSSDGVWFGHHDQSLDRVTKTSGNPLVSDMTWNQIQQFSITSGSDGVIRPFMTIDDYIEAYSDSCVTVLDIKYGIQSATFIDEFFEICSRFPKDKIIVKSFYDSTSFADRSTNAGYATWGYAYDTSLTDPQLASRLPHWSILGLNWDASQQDWDTVLSYGKPVVGHIANTQAAYNMAISKGATGVQCSNVLGIKAVGTL